MLHRILILMALPGLVGCDAMRSPEKNHDLGNPTLLRAYEVPLDRSQDIASSLAMALGESGSVSSVNSSRQILVLAPLSMHDSIARSVETLTQDDEAPDALEAGDFAVRLDAWIVDEAPTQDPSLSGLDDLLATLSSTTGVRGFARYTSMSAQAVANNGTLEASDRLARIVAQFRAASGGVRSELEVIDMSGFKLKVDTLLPFDQFVVLGQGVASADGGSRFVIVRAAKL